jgi:hypothetical protein
VRRWVCIVALLAGFSGDRYPWTVRQRTTVPIERVIDRLDRDPALPGRAWWRLT